jgi:hypothetical protein
MRRGVLVVLVALGMAGALSVPAGAEIAQFDIAAQGKVKDGKAIIKGNIKCSSSEDYRVKVVVTRSGKRLRGSDRGDCHGAPQTWKAVAKDRDDRATVGTWRVCATPGDTSGDKEPVCRNVQLVK